MQSISVHLNWRAFINTPMTTARLLNALQRSHWVSFNEMFGDSHLRDPHREIRTRSGYSWDVVTFTMSLLSSPNNFCAELLLTSPELKIWILPTWNNWRINKETESFLASSQSWTEVLAGLYYAPQRLAPYPSLPLPSSGHLLNWRPTSFLESGVRLQEPWARVMLSH